MQKDYWNIAKRNFRALAILSIIPIILLGLGILDSRNPNSVRMTLLVIIGFFLLTCIIYFIIASLFKKRSPKAIIVGYTWLGISFVLALVNDLILNSPADFFSKGVAVKVISYLILIYLFMNVYKASKQSTAQVV